MGEVCDHINCVVLTEALVSALDLLFDELVVTGDLNSTHTQYKRQVVVEFLLKFYKSKNTDNPSDARVLVKSEKVDAEDEPIGISSTESKGSDIEAPKVKVTLKAVKIQTRASKSKVNKRKISRKLSKINHKSLKYDDVNALDDNGSVTPDNELSLCEGNGGMIPSDGQMEPETVEMADSDKTELNQINEIQSDIKSEKQSIDTTKLGSDGNENMDSDDTISNHERGLDSCQELKSGSEKDEQNESESEKDEQNESESGGVRKVKKKIKTKKAVRKKTKVFKKREKQSATNPRPKPEDIEEDDEVNYRKIEEITSDLKTYEIFFRVRGKKPMVLMCRACGRQFNKRDHMIHHVRSHTGERPYKCKFCDKAYNRSSHLARHAIIHMDMVVKRPPRKKNFKCDQCSAAYDCRYKLHEHKALHTGEKPNKCLKCDFRTRCRENLRRHMAAMHGTGPRVLYECPECSKVYTSRASLKDHLKRSHEDVNPVVCEVCGKNFKTLTGLKEHYICHDDKVFKCQYCKFKTNRPKYFKQHEANHVMKICQCEICGKGLSSLGALKNHITSVHGPKVDLPKVYTCRVCGATYDNKQSMNSHMRKHKNRLEEHGSKSVSEETDAKMKSKTSDIQVMRLPPDGDTSISINNSQQGTKPAFTSLKPTETSLGASQQNNAESSQNSINRNRTMDRTIDHTDTSINRQIQETSLRQAPHYIIEPLNRPSSSSVLPMPLNLERRSNQDLSDSSSIMSRSRGLEQCQQVPIDGACVPPRASQYERTNVFGSVHEHLHSINASSQDIIKYSYHNMNVPTQDYIKYS